MHSVKKEPFKVSVNSGQYEFEIMPDQAQGLDLISNGESAFHLLQNNQAYHVEVLAADYISRTYTLRIDGIKYVVGISDYYERLVQQLGLHAGGGLKINSIKAPMPGLVISVLVEPGQTVQKGDPLIILEAMKMENVIKAAGEGIVKKVNAEKGHPVDKGHTLLEFE